MGNNSIIGRIRKYSKILNDNNVIKILLSFIPNMEINRTYMLGDKLVVEFNTDNVDYNNFELILNDEEILIKKDNGVSIEETKIYDSKRLYTTIYEMHEKGYIIRRITRDYDYTKYSDKEKKLTDLKEVSYIFSNVTNNKELTTLRDVYNKYSNILFGVPLEYDADEITEFNSHMKYLIKDEHGRWMLDTLATTYTYANEEDISKIYDIVDGPAKVSIIYDLYNGIIDHKNEEYIYSINLGLLNSDAYDLKNKIGIKKLEEDIVGKMLPISNHHYAIYIINLLRNKYDYKGDILLDNDFINDVITYKPSGIEVVKRELEKNIGMPYDKFETLDADDQHEVLKEARENKIYSKTRKKVINVTKLIKEKFKTLRKTIKK